MDIDGDLYGNCNPNPITYSYDAVNPVDNKHTNCNNGNSSYTYSTTT